MSKKKITKIFISFSLLLVLIINTIDVNINADTTPKELNQMGFVDEITMTPSKLRYGNTTKINVTFSQKQYSINSGDTLTLKRPDNIELFNFDTETIELFDSQTNKVYATAKLSKNKELIVITFNDNVKSFSEFEGNFYFSGKAGWVAPENQTEWNDFIVDYKTDLGTDAPKVDYSISTTMVIGTNPFVYKTNGSIWPSNRGYVSWNININRDQNLFLSDLYITDEFSAGQEFALVNESLPLSNENLDPSRIYFSMKDEKDGDSIRYTIPEFIEKGFGTFTLDPLNTRKFELVVFKDKVSPTQNLNFGYQTKITDDGKFMPKFYNSAISKWKLTDGTPQVREDLNREADNIFEGGIIAPKKGTLRIVKTINDNGKSEQLGEVTFKMFHEDGTPVSKLENLVLKTNSEGVFDTPVLDQGKYYITEISAPNYATFDPNEKFPFEIKDTDLIGISLVVPNGLKKQSIKVEKQWFDNEITHDSIFVDLLADNVKINTVELKEGKWSHEFSNLPTHTLKGEKINYTVEESPVNGYKSIVSGNETDGFIIENRLNGQIAAEKRTNKDTVSVGEKFSYTILARNTVKDSMSLNDVSIKDTLPEGIEFTDSIIYIDGVAQAGVINDRDFEVIIPTLAYGKDVEVTFEVIATGTKLEKIVNKATVTNPEDPTNPIEPEVPVVVTPDEAVITAEKLVSKKTVNVNEKFNYTVKVSNTTSTSLPLENVSVKDTLPEGIEFTNSIIYIDGVAQAGVINDRDFEVIIPTLAYGKDVEVTFEVIATGSKLETVVNKATVTNPEDPTNPIEPEVPVVVTPDKAIVTAEKLVSKDTVNVNEKFNYTIKVSNTTATSLPVENVSVKDTLPEGIEFTDSVIYVDGVAQAGVINGRSFEVIIPSLAYGKDVEVTFEVVATGSKLETIVNKAIVTNPEDPTNPIEPEVPVVVTPDKAIIIAEKFVDKAVVNVNEKFIYTIKVSNTTATSLPVENVSVKDTLPEGIEFADSIIYVDGVAQDGVVSGRGFEVIIPSLAYGKDVEVTFEVIATGTKLGGIVNIAKITNPEDPTNPIEPEVPVVVTPDKAIVTAEKIVSKDTVNVNEKFNYTIKVSNTTATSLPVENVSVKDTLPEGIEFTDSVIYVDGVAQDGVINGRSFEAIIPSLAYGKDVAVTFEVVATGSKLETVVNKATVTNPEDPTDPIEPEVPVVVTPDKAIVTAEKLVSKDTVNVNEKFNYTIKVSNTTATSLPVENVSVKDTLPEGIEFTDSVIYVDGVAQDGVVSGRSFEVIIPSLAYGKDVEVTFEVVATGSKLEIVVNKATVTNPEDPTNPIEPEVPVIVTPDKGKIAAEKIVNKDTISVNETFIYSIKVKNIVKTSLPMKNIVVKDSLPEGISFTDKIIYVNGVAKTGLINGVDFEVVIPSLAYGEDIVVSFETKASGTKIGETINKAKVVNPEDPTNPIEPEVPVVVTPDKAVITSEKLVSNNTVNVNEKFKYTIKVSNTTATSLPVENVSVKDTLPEGIEFTDSIIYVDGVAQEGVVSGRGFEVKIPSLAYGKDVEVTFEVIATGSKLETVVNKATVTNPEDPTNPIEPEVPVVVTPDRAVITAEKLVSKDTVNVNEKFIYTIQVSNTTSTSLPIENVSIKDILPEGIEFTDSIIYVDGVAQDGIVNGRGFEVIIPSLANGKDVEVTFEVIATGSKLGGIVNVAKVTNPEDPTNPIEPEVPVTVVPVEPVNPTNPVEPNPIEPVLPTTGVTNYSNVNYLLLILGSIFVLISGKKRKSI